MQRGYKYLIVLMMLLLAVFSYWYSGFPGVSDFVVFYGASNVILDRSIPVIQVYDPDVLSSVLHLQGITTEHLTLTFKYSLFAAYLLSPLAILSFRGAETVFVFLNLLCYTVSILVILKSYGAKNRWFVYPLACSFLWLPFIKNIHYGQINATLFLFLTLGIVFARNQRPELSGIFLAIGTLFKPFFLAVTMILCIKNSRILRGYLPTVILALLLPGTGAWFNSFFWPPHPFHCYSAAYNYLSQISVSYFYIYALGIGAVTAWITYRNNHIDLFTAASFGIIGSFLAMPVLEANHLTLLIFCYIWFLFQSSGIQEKVVVATSFILINIGSCTIYGGSLVYAGLLILWAETAYMVINRAGNIGLAPGLGVNPQ